MCSHTNHSDIILTLNNRRGNPQLFDLQSDPHERVNCFEDDQYHDVKKEMINRLIGKLWNIGHDVSIR